MSLPEDINVSINGRMFEDYEHLAIHVKFIINDYVKKSGTINEKQLIKSLEEFKDNLRFGKNRGIYEYLIKVNFHDACVDIVKLCIEDKNVKVLTAILSCIISIADNSKEMCTEFTRSGFIEVLINLTIKVCSDSFGSKHRKSLFDQLILIVDNIAHYPECQQCFIRCKNIATFKQKIQQFLTSKDHRTRILTMAALTWLIEEDEDKTRLNLYSDIINHFVEYINKALNDKNRSCEGLRISGMLDVILSLSNIQLIKTSMIQMHSFMAQISSLIASDKTPSWEKEVALSIMHNLTFKNISKSEEVIENSKIKDVCDFENVIKPLINDSNPNIKRIAENVISDSSENPDLSNIEIIFDIFVSYCVSDKGRIAQIADILTKKEFKVLRHEETVKESNINEVKESIAQSRMLVLGVSNSYYNNPSCHSECQYAYQLKKPILPLIMEPEYIPRDWLKEMIPVDPRIDFSDGSKFDAFTQKLLKHVEDTISKAGTKKPMMSKLKTLSFDKSFMEEKPIKDWSKEDVGEWLLSKGLSTIKKKIEKYDGKMLEYMRTMRVDSRKEYNKRLKGDLNLDLNEEIAFDEALENLEDRSAP